MKKFIVYIGMLILLQGTNISPLQYEELESIMKMADEMGMELDTWELIALDKISNEQKQEVIDWLETSSETIEEDENGISFNYLKAGYIRINIKLMHESNKVQIVFSGNDWNESEQATLRKIWMEFQQVIFTKNTNLYTCVKFNDNGIMIDGIYTTEIQEKLKVKPIFDQKDNLKDTAYEGDYYGYSPSWKSEINVNKEKINFQMAVKSHSQNEKEIIIGTPAILNEY